MKKYIVVLMLCCPLWTMAQTTDSLLQVQQSQIIALQKKVQSVEQNSNAYRSQIGELKAQTEALNVALKQKQASIDSLASVVKTNSTDIQTTADKLGVKIQTTEQAVSTKAVWGIVAVVVALLISVIVALLLHKKGQKTSDDKIALLKKQADELNEKIVGQFSNEMSELQKIGDALKNVGNSTSAEPDHSLVKTLADRITFMEMTLYRMDSSVKGHKTLVTAIGNMKNNLLANGYEIVDMLGKPYDDGMSVNRVDYVDDETLEKGISIVTKVIKPQINYNGKMIQSAQIQVNQNL